MQNAAVGSFSRKKRAALIVVVAVLALGNLWWYSRPSPSEKLEYQLKPATADIIVDRPDQLPLFDDKTDRWFIDGKPEKSVAVKRIKGDNRHGPSWFLPFRVQENAGTNAVRRALLAASREGICYVGIYDGVSVEGIEQKQETIGMFVIDWVRDDRGAEQKCRSSAG